MHSYILFEELYAQFRLIQWTLCTIKFDSKIIFYVKKDVFEILITRPGYFHASNDTLWYISAFIRVKLIFWSKVHTKK